MEMAWMQPIWQGCSFIEVKRVGHPDLGRSKRCS
jgi:hypothetical protein